MTIIDDLIEDYGNNLQDIYERRTAGAFTFVGVLSEFLRAVVDSAPPTAPARPSEPNVEHRTIESHSTPERFYAVTLVDGLPVACTCPAFHFQYQTTRRSCKHIHEMVDISELSQ